MKRIATPEERKRALAKARKKLKSTEVALADDEAKELYVAFMARYAQMEVAYKSLLADYLEAHGEKTTAEGLKVRWRQVQSVLSYFSIDLGDDGKRIFHGRQKTGERYAKGLRDSLAHSPNKAAIDELRDKKSSLEASMNTFEEALGANTIDEREGE